jgi:predicted transcriptional regulator
MKLKDFTIKDLTTHLYWDESNARRIVVSLCEVNLAEIIGEESYSSRGRPSKIYRLK